MDLLNEVMCVCVCVGYVSRERMEPKVIDKI